MTRLKYHNLTYFFDCARLARQMPEGLIYSILIDSGCYYLAKTIGLEDYVQIDNKPLKD